MAFEGYQTMRFERDGRVLTGRRVGVPIPEGIEGTLKGLPPRRSPRPPGGSAPRRTSTTRTTRAAVRWAYVRWDEGDASDFAPALVGRSARPRGADERKDNAAPIPPMPQDGSDDGEG